MPITINQNGVILDGHTRYKICRELGIKPVFETKEFDNEYDERRFVIVVNLSRRQLSKFQKGELAFNWYESERSDRYHRAGTNTWKTRRGQTYRKQKRLMSRFGELIGVSHSAAHLIIFLIRNADEKMKSRLRNGTIELQTAYNQVKKPKYLNRKYDTEYIRYPKCLKCNSKTEKFEKTGCHVHDNACCSKCSWGY